MADKPIQSTVIYGGGEQGRIVADALVALGIEVMGVVDQVPPAGWRRPWLGEESGVLASHKKFPWHVAIGDNRVRDDILRRISQQLELSPLVVVHPSAVIGSEVNLGPGTFVAAGAIVAHSARLGAGCLINHGATVDHDCALGRAVHVAPGAHLAGRVRVGAHTLIGIGAAIIPGIVIGEDAVVGAGAVVLKDVPAKATVVGNPARKI